MTVVDVQLNLTKARADLVFYSPFYGAIVLRLKMKEDASQPTFAVDGYTIFYNPDFAATLTLQEFAGILAHEVLHVALLHHTRMGNRIHIIWNMAADYAINPIVLKNPKLRLPKDALLDPNYEGMTAEQVYELLIKKPEIQQVIADAQALAQAVKDYLDGRGEKMFDEIKAPPAGMQGQAEQDAKSLANTGLAAAKQAGKLPGGMEGILDGAHEVQVDWQDRLREMLTNTTRGDLVWHRPNKRLMETAYLPYYEQEPAGNLTLALDSSASVSNPELEIYGTELRSIMRDNNIEDLTVLWVDTAVRNVQRFNKDDDIILKIKGRGGTRFEPAFEWVEEHGETPDAFIYFTDGEASFPEEPPPYPVIWCITGKDQEPWGDTIELKF